MPSYSGGNRWVGVLALTPPPVPPPLHRIARDRIGARSRGSLYIKVRGARVSIETAERALSLFGRALGTYDDLLRQATCFTLTRALRHSKTRPKTWLYWAQNAVLAYADHPQYFELKNRNPKEWRLASSRRTEASKDRNQRTPKKPTSTPTRRNATSGTYAPPTRPLLNVDVINVTSPVLLDPGGALDDLPLNPGLEKALAEAGWPCNSVLRRRWIKLSVMHASYLYEFQNDIPINSETLRMLDSLGSPLASAIHT